MSVRAPAAPGTTVRPGEVVRPLWRRLRFWVGVGLVVLLSAALLSLATDPSNDHPLDPDSYSHAGSAAVARLIEGYGIAVHRTTDLDAAAASGETVVVAFPARYSAAELARLRSDVPRLILVGVRSEQLGAAGSPLRTAGHGSSPDPGCTWPGALAAGRADIPAGSYSYLPAAGYQICYGGAVAVSDRLVALGSPDLLANVHQADRGVAAIAVNALSADRSVGAITWLMPGVVVAGASRASLWDLFPPGVHRAVLYLLPLTLLLAFWRGRRFGPVVSEPLPVVVRSAELVEGHGRLYWRAGARDRAAAAVRAGSLHRVAERCGLAALPPPTGPDVVAAVAARVGAAEPEIANLLLGPPPATDAGLLVLADDLDRLERAAGVPARSPKDTSEPGGTPR